MQLMPPQRLAKPASGPRSQIVRFAHAPIRPKRTQPAGPPAAVRARCARRDVSAARRVCGYRGSCWAHCGASGLTGLTGRFGPVYNTNVSRTPQNCP